MKKVEPKSVGDLLHIFVGNDVQLRKGLLEARAVRAWSEVTGEAAAAATTRIYIRDGILHVFVSSSVLRSEIFMNRGRVTREINARLGELVVKGIVVR